MKSPWHHRDDAALQAADARALADAVFRHPAGRKRGERVAPVIDIRTREVIE